MRLAFAVISLSMCAGVALAGAPITSIDSMDTYSGVTTTSMPTEPSSYSGVPSFNSRSNSYQTSSASSADTPVYRPSYVSSNNNAELESRITKLEKQIQSLNNVNNSLNAKLQTQLQTISDLQNQIEALNQRLVTSQQAQRAAEQKSIQLENAQRVAKAKALAQAEAKPKVQANTVPVALQAEGSAVAPMPAPTPASLPSPAPAPVPAAAPSIPAAPSPQETQAYNSAYNLVVSKQYDAAISAFQSFVTSYPQSSQIVGAHYWLGELYLTEGEADLATQQFKQVISMDPKNSKAPDAMLKLGTIFLTTGDAAHAKEMFQRVATEYKGTPYGNLAAKQLQAMQ